MLLDRGGGWLGCAGQVDDFCESEPQRLPGNYLLHLAMSGLFFGLIWLNCLQPLSYVGAASFDWAGNRF